MINPWLGIGLVLVMLFGLMSGLGWYRRQYGPHPELVRKLLHVSMGLVALSFPWLFASDWPAVLLASITIPLMVSLRHFKNLKNHFGGVIDGVGRGDSLGEIFFPLGVGVLFVLADGDPLLYGIPLLLLTLADAAAALIGIRYGLTYYITADERKSVEGSAAFFAVAFFSTDIPLHFLSESEPLEALLIALLLAFMMAVVEAISWRGLDNLFIPVLGFILLGALLNMTLFQLIIGLVIVVWLVGLILLWGKLTSYINSLLLGSE
jgi:phytol kinase